jgi:DNA-binding MarR family transcriptional regulator
VTKVTGMKKKVNGIGKKQLEEIQQKVSEYTGEDKVSVSIHKTDNANIPASVFLFQHFARISSIQMNGSTSRVLLFLLSIQGYENIVGVDIKTISETLGMSERTTMRSMKSLEEFNVIKRYPNFTDRRRNDYFVNPLATWKGKSRNRLKQMAEIHRHQLSLDLFDGAIVNDQDLNKDRKGKQLKALPKPNAKE